MVTQGKNSDFPDKNTLRKYLKGELTPKEAHRFEKLILNDPFYQEALEGLESVDSELADKDLAQLSGRIKMRAQAEKRSYIQVYRIAAVVALVAVFSYIIIIATSRIDKVTQGDIITLKQDEVEEVTPSEEKTITALQEIETTQEDQPLADIYDEIQESPDKVIAARRSEQSLETGDKGEQGHGPETLDEAITEHIQTGKTVISDREEENYVTEASSETDEDFEVVGDQESETMAYEPENKLTAQKDRKDISPAEETELQSRTIKDPAAITTDYAEILKNKRMRSETEDMPVAAKVSEISAAPAIAPESYVEKTSGPGPVTGFEAYLNYIEENLRYPKQEPENKIEGKVELRFIVNQDSIPDKFQIIQSLNDHCDKEAIRLLKEGPKWIPVYQEGKLKEVEVNYSIPFRLEDR